MTKTFYEGDLNFAEINKRLKKEKPTKLTQQEIVTRLRGGMEDALTNGISHERLSIILKNEYGIEMAHTTLRRYLADGKPGTHLNRDNAERAADELESITGDDGASEGELG